MLRGDRGWLKRSRGVTRDRSNGGGKNTTVTVTTVSNTSQSSPIQPAQSSTYKNLLKSSIGSFWKVYSAVVSCHNAVMQIAGK